MWYIEREERSRVYFTPKKVTAVDDLMRLKECSREEAFNIIQEWNKEFTEKYGNCDFDGSYYDVIDEFIDKKLGTI